MHTSLRRATASSHDALDVALGSLDLATYQGYARFLRAHAIGLAPLSATFRDFVEGTLRLAAPDYPALLAADLAALGGDAGPLPVARVRGELAPAGVTYVIAGSRLGLATIRRRPCWRSSGAAARGYIEDTAGIGIWRALLAWMAAEPFTTEEARSLTGSANTAFDVFARAFVLSGETAPLER